MESWTATLQALYHKPGVRVTLLVVYYTSILVALLLTYGHEGTAPAPTIYQDF